MNEEKCSCRCKTCDELFCEMFTRLRKIALLIPGREIFLFHVDHMFECDLNRDSLFHVPIYGGHSSL